MPTYTLKRLIDIGLSLVLLVITSPLFGLALLLTLADGHRHPLFIQRRLGLHCREFNIYKFRTMKSPPLGATPTHIRKPGAQELTPIAHFLRKTNLDELPQLFNVLKGDMSLVGPRPHVIEDARYDASVYARYYERYRVRPGLACIVEVTPLHYLTETSEHIVSRINCDLYYIAHLSLMLDLRILWRILCCTFMPGLYNPAQPQQVPATSLPYTAADTAGNRAVLIPQL